MSDHVCPYMYECACVGASGCMGVCANVPLFVLRASLCVASVCCACLRVCALHVCVCVYVRVRVNLQIVGMFAWCVYVHACLRMCVLVCSCVCACACACVYACVNACG